MDLISKGIDRYNAFVTGEGTENTTITFFIKNSKDKIIGGVHGTYNISGWLYINCLWVAEGHRTKGYGTLLMQSIEAEAKNRRCTNSYLNTIAFQAPAFYEKLGYKIFAELENFHQDYSKFFLRKRI